MDTAAASSLTFRQFVSCCASFRPFDENMCLCVCICPTESQQACLSSDDLAPGTQELKEKLLRVFADYPNHHRPRAHGHTHRQTDRQAHTGTHLSISIRNFAQRWVPCGRWRGLTAWDKTAGPKGDQPPFPALTRPTWFTTQ